MSSQERGNFDSDHIVRVCSAQIASTWEEPERTLLRAETFIRHAADCGAKLICFPEQFATGWDPRPHKNIQDIHGDIISSLRAYAKKYRIGILGSLREVHDPLPKNTVIAIGRNGGILASYSKMHLFSFCREHEGNSPGSDLGIFAFDSLTCGIAICYDLRFPELFRLYAKNSVQAVFVPAAWPQSRLWHWGSSSSTGCRNQMYVLGILARKDSVDTYAASMTQIPTGRSSVVRERPSNCSSRISILEK
jgi:predicted amidohydrolase